MLMPAPGGPAPRRGARGPTHKRGTRLMPDRPRLAATNRTVIGKKVSHLRREGRLPAVVYGHGVASESVSVDAHEFELLKRKVGASTLVDLAVDGGRTRPPPLHATHVPPIRPPPPPPPPAAPRWRAGGGGGRRAAPRGGPPPRPPPRARRGERRHARAPG